MLASEAGLNRTARVPVYRGGSHREEGRHVMPITETATRTPATSTSPALQWAVRVVGAGLLLAMALIHLKLWNDGYRDIRWIGPLFMTNAVLGILGAVAVLGSPRRWLPWFAMLGGLLEIGTLLGLILSLTIGLFGFKETWGGLVLPTIIVEAAGFVVLCGYGASALLPLLRQRRAVR
jgi:hypothetical protein